MGNPHIMKDTDGAVVLGVGMCVPDRVVTNDELAPLLSTTAEWIERRTGVRERRYADPSLGSAALAAHAAKRALAAASLDPAAVDCLIIATLSPDYEFPGNGMLVQELLGLTNMCPAMDVRVQCSGFLYALEIADALIRAGKYQHVVLIGCEVHSAGLEMAASAKEVTALFGDGAGALVLGRRDGRPGRGIIDTELHADGRFARELWLSGVGVKQTPRVTEDMLRDGSLYPRMNGPVVLKYAMKRMPEVATSLLMKHGLTVSDIDLFVFHQANIRILKLVQEKMELPDRKLFINIHKYGNTTAASIPICIAEAEQSGALQRGTLMMLVSFGAGFSWGAALVGW